MPVDTSPPPLRRTHRIAVVTETYPPEINGAAMSIAHIVDGLRRRRHEVQLVRPRQPGDDRAGGRDGHEEMLTGGWPIPHYPNLRMGASSTAALVAAWTRARPDVVHVATEGPLGWSALRAARGLRLPVTTDFRTNFHAYGVHYRLGWLARPIMAYLRRFHNRAQATMVPTEAMRAQLAAQGFERLAVVSRGVDTGLFHPARRSDALRADWGADERTLVLCSVGRLAAEKNLGVALRAHEALRERLDAVQMVFVGDGPMRPELQQRCSEAVFAGQRRGEDLAAHYASADVFLFPSLTDTFGNVTLEAMASGLAVIAFDCAAAGQFIRPGEDGLLAVAGDASAFVDAALALAADPGRAAALGSRARRTAGRLAWDDVTSRFEAVLTAVIDDSQAPQGAGAWRHAPHQTA